ncbi:MAG: hypothetical protein LUC32_03320, partial [Clostridiales bacterium]|nr:hypothetical protein [Clostridiales bacterium]
YWLEPLNARQGWRSKMKVYLSIDPIAYREKPKGKKIIEVKRRCCDNWQQMDVGQVADLVGNRGHAMIPGHMVGGMKAENCTEMQLLALDFDGGVAFQEIKARCDSFGVNISFAYRD